MLGHVHRQFDELPDRGARPVAARQRHVVATHADRKKLFVEAGHLIVDLAQRYYEQNDDSVLPRSIAGFKAFENAMSLDIAMGGSTNTVSHLLAAAYEAELDFTMVDIDRLSRRVPVLCKVAPSVPDVHVEDVHRAGGIMAFSASSIAPICSTATSRWSTPSRSIRRWRAGTSSAARRRRRAILLRRAGRRADAGRVQPGGALGVARRGPREGVIRDLDHAFSKDGGLAVLKGNLALDGCIVKTAGVDASVLKFEGPAKVFESQDDASRGILAGEVVAGDVVVIRYEGPRGGRACRKCSTRRATSSRRALGKLRADHRRPLLRRHLGPVDRPRLAEAAEGGAMALVEPGDRIAIDIPKRTVELKVAEAELERRRAAIRGQGQGRLEAGGAAAAPDLQGVARLRRLRHQRRARRGARSAVTPAQRFAGARRRERGDHGRAGRELYRAPGSLRRLRSSATRTVS